MLKTAFEHFEHEGKRENCELCLNKFRPELLRDIDILLMFEKGIRGGITQAVKRYTKADNKQWMSNDPKTPNTWVTLREESRGFSPEKAYQLLKERQTRAHFRS